MHGRRVLLLGAVVAVLVAGMALTLGAHAVSGMATSGVHGAPLPGHPSAPATTVNAGCSLFDPAGCLSGAWTYVVNAANATYNAANNALSSFTNYLTSFVDGLIVGAVSAVLIGGLEPLINGIANALASSVLALTSMDESIAIILGPFSAPIFVGVLLAFMVGFTVAFKALKDIPIVGAFA